MGGSTKSTQQQQSTSTNTLDPTYKAAVMDNLAGAQQRASTLTPYTGQLTAGFNPTQLQAQGVLSGIATDPTYAANNNSAINSVSGILGPTGLGDNSSFTYDPATIAGSDLSKYMNPYTSDVIDASINQNERARQIAGVNDAQKASAAGAFGGSRSGVLSSLTNEAYDRNNQQNIAALNQANYNQAQGAAATDAATTNTAAQSNINNRLAAYGLQLNAAGQLVSLNNQALGTAATQGGILASVGDAQQAQEQKALTDAYNAYTQGQQLTVEQQQLINSALGIVPNQQTINSSGTGTTKQSTNPGLGGILSSLGSIAQGAAMFA